MRLSGDVFCEVEAELEMLLQKIYDLAPIWVQNVMCSVKGWMIVRKRFSKDFLRELRHMERREENPDELLKNFLEEARNVPAYAEVFNSSKGEVSLNDFPIINKAYVKEHYEEFYNRNYKGPTLVIHTSGTTGTSINIPQSQSFEHRQWATWWRYREELGIEYDTWYGWFGSGVKLVPVKQKKPPYWRVDFVGKRVMFGTSHLNFDTVDDYVREIKRRNLSWLHGHASRLCYLSRLIIEKGIAPIENVRFVTTGSENLLPPNVIEIQRAFPNAIVRTHYGQTEGVANFSQTKEGDWRIDDDFAKVEFIPIDPKNLERCRIVGTNFSNPYFPLIRYDMGDIACVKWVDGKPIVQGIEGRDNELITLANGTLVSALVSYEIFCDQENVREAQLRVLDSGHELELLVVKGSKFTAKDETAILEKTRRHLKDDICLSIRYTDAIPRAPSGKFRAVVSA